MTRRKDSKWSIPNYTWPAPEMNEAVCKLMEEINEQMQEEFTGTRSRSGHPRGHTTVENNRGGPDNFATTQEKSSFYDKINCNPYDYIVRHREGYKKARFDSFKQSPIWTEAKDAEVLGVY